MTPVVFLQDTVCFNSGKICSVLFIVTNTFLLWVEINISAVKWALDFRSCLFAELSLTIVTTYHAEHK